MTEKFFLFDFAIYMRLIIDPLIGNKLAKIAKIFQKRSKFFYIEMNSSYDNKDVGKNNVLIQSIKPYMEMVKKNFEVVDFSAYAIAK